MDSSSKAFYATLVVRGLKAAIDSLPPLPDITIKPHNECGSDHPYKILVGHTRAGGARVWVRLGSTPARATYAPDMVYHISNRNTALCLSFTSLEDVDLVEPFRTLWEKTRSTVTTGDWDKRRGWMKGLCYWYWVEDAEQRGVQIRVANSIWGYLVGGVKRVGVMERGKRDGIAKNVMVERSGTKEAANVLGRLGGLEVEQRGVEIRIRNTDEVKKREKRLETLRQELRQLEELDAAQGANIQLVDGLDARGRVRDGTHMENN
jgi:hypothetical protein